ncbi:S-layer homology domain-containing protein [bacterium]|nr:S-layer homology domain-containing protein [bacterium]
MNHFKKIFGLVVFVFAFTVFAGTVLASSTNGVIDPVYKYAWSENSGWITFGESGGNVHVTDTVLTGMAWSANHGWLNLNPATAGVVNDGDGNLSGQAWGANLGWVDFAGVTIDSNGYFHGYANGTVTGKISFNCANTSSCGASDFKVRTDWKPRSSRPACNNGLDDDGDGKIDYPSDPGCQFITDNDETDPVAGGRPPNYSHGGDNGSGEELCVVPFDDTEGHWAKRYIDELFCAGIVSGRSKYKFVPNGGATRAEVTKIALLMNEFNIDESLKPDFSDVGIDHWAYNIIANGEDSKIIEGYEDGYFRPNQKVTRAELAKIFLLASGFTIPDKVSYSFPDVPDYAWYYKVVSYAFSLDIVSGYADGLFKPDQEITRAEVAKIAVYVMHMKQ